MSEQVQVPLEKIADMAVEHWRLSSTLGPILERSSSAPLRHALRKMEDFFKFCQIEIRSLEGQSYDPGLAARVIDSVSDPELPRGSSVISETLSPLILYKQAVLRPADIVVSTNG